MRSTLPDVMAEFPLYELEENAIDCIDEIVVECGRCGAELNKGTSTYKLAKGFVGKGEFIIGNDMFEFEEESYIYLCECCMTINKTFRQLADKLGEGQN